MGDPPDRPNLPILKWDKSKHLNFESNDPVFLMMKRINSSDSLSSVSPFLIKKAIDSTCSPSSILECKKTRSGDILIKTTNSHHANKLITLTALNNNIEVEITPHVFLNSSKGVMYCNELRGIPESEILQELASEKFIEVKKIKRQDNTLVETGLIVLTFSTSNFPLRINIDYLKVEIRQYIPQAMRCKSCFKYNYTAKFCKNPKICPNCSNPHHLAENEKCYLPEKCTNCSSMNINPTNHSAYNKKCPIFIKENELQAIKTTYKIDRRAAISIYNDRHQHDNNTYASITQNTHSSTINKNNATTSRSQNPPPTPSVLCTSTTSTNSDPSFRSLRSYTDLSTFESPQRSAPLPPPKGIVKILPKNASKRPKAVVKKNASTIISASQNNTDSDTMDF